MKTIYTSYRDLWTRTLDFKGRSTNEDYWWPFFINLGICLIFIYIINMSELAILYNVLVAVPFIALSIRRMHDANKSGWNILWLYIPTVILLIYAGSILFYTQTPEIVDLFLKWFTVMVVGYVVLFVYSVYLLTQKTYPKKNHYGQVPSLQTNTKNDENNEVILEVMEGSNIEDTLTFKTKAFIEKAKKRKKKDEKPSDTEKLDNKIEETEKPVEIKVKKKVNKPALEPTKVETPVIVEKEDLKKAIVEVNLAEEKEEIIVRAQLKPSKKPPVKVAKPISKPENKEIEPKVKEEDKEVVKTITQKRAETQKVTPSENNSLDKKEAETKKGKAEAKIVHRPIKRKAIQPIEIPDMNVETIRTHSLDSIAKLVEQNMTKDPKDAPTVVATVKRRPVKRKKKEE